DGPSALEAFTAASADFDVVMTDMTMPKMTGEDLAQKIKAIRPDIPVILCTGFARDLNPEEAKARGISGYLKKPAQLSELSQMMRRVLDEAKR
ncbi:MAG: response regulator, partial [Thermodesulfobacteriota bacterium]